MVPPKHARIEAEDTCPYCAKPIYILIFKTEIKQMRKDFKEGKCKPRKAGMFVLSQTQYDKLLEEEKL